MRYIIPISGKDSLATALVQKEREPHLPYEYFYNPTGMDLPEVDPWLNLVSAHLDAPIHRVGDDLEAIIYEQGILPAHKTRYCTRLAKIFPMEEWLHTPYAIYLLAAAKTLPLTANIQSIKLILQAACDLGDYIEPATVYYGIRADERRAGYQSISGGGYYASLSA
jgi:hypothetical protein